MNEPIVRKNAAYVPVSDEAIVDYELGTAQDQRYAQGRIVYRELRAKARWRALPWWTRLHRTILIRWHTR